MQPLVSYIYTFDSNIKRKNNHRVIFITTFNSFVFWILSSILTPKSLEQKTPINNLIAFNKEKPLSMAKDDNILLPSMSNAPVHLGVGSTGKERRRKPADLNGLHS